MGILTVDFETYYDSDDYSLSKMQTEEYINDWRFENIVVAVKKDDEKTKWYSGTHEEIKKELEKYDWENNHLLAHNTKFDGAILHWKFGLKPNHYLDTLCMAQACVGHTTNSISLDELSYAFDLGVKGKQVKTYDKMNRIDFTPEQLKDYASYCMNDVDLTYSLFWKLWDTHLFPDTELDLIHNTLKMFIEPKFELDIEALEKESQNINAIRNGWLLKVGVPSKVLRSSKQFPILLAKYGIKPLKSYAKDNDDFLKLRGHPNPKVRDIVEARLCWASNGEPNRIERLLASAKRNNGLHVPLKYYGAHTGRWSGQDKINLQNVSKKAVGLKKSFKAPKGRIVIDFDLRQIEPRILSYISEQEDLLETFREGSDVYIKMASRIFQKDPGRITKAERDIGKALVIGCGYGIGVKGFHTYLLKQGISIPQGETYRIHSRYKSTIPKIINFWNQCSEYIENVAVYRKASPIGKPGILKTDENGILLPNGMRMNYFNLEIDKESPGYYQKYCYSNLDDRPKNIWHGLVAENIVQALARIVIGDHINSISKRYDVALTIHDSIVCIVPEEEEAEAFRFIKDTMTTAPHWAEDLPLDCEIKTGSNYGDLKEVKEIEYENI